MKVMTINRVQGMGLMRVACLLMVAQLGLVTCTSMGTSLPTTSTDGAFELTPPPNFTRGLLERRAPDPLYPIRAQNLGVEGWVMLGFSVDENGDVVNSSIRTLQEQPEGYFEASAISAARRLSFQNFRSELVEDVRYVFRYELDGLPAAPPADATPNTVQFREMLPQRLITPRYPPAALEQEVEGYVVVKFTVTEQGAVQDIVIDESDPAGVFDAEALRAAQLLRFDPRIVLGGAVRVEDVSYRFDWVLPR